jgi:hypothetical protein
MSKNLSRMAAMTAAAIPFTLVLSGCTPDVPRTYADQSGTWRLELKSGGWRSRANYARRFKHAG